MIRVKLHSYALIYGCCIIPIILPATATSPELYGRATFFGRQAGRILSVKLGAAKIVWWDNKLIIF